MVTEEMVISASEQVKEELQDALNSIEFYEQRGIKFSIKIYKGGSFMYECPLTFGRWEIEAHHKYSHVTGK